MSLHKRISLENIFTPNNKPKRTKVVCTLGPASDSVETIVKMMDAGMNVARLNFSHGDHESKMATLKKIEEARAERPNLNLAVLLDTKGPEIRTGFLASSSGVQLKKGDLIEISTDYSIKGNNKRISCSYKSLPTSVKVGDNILVADGSLVMTVVELKETSVMVEMMNGGKLGERKNMNLPGNKVNLPTITEKDEVDIKAFAKHVDFIAVSFVQHGNDLALVKAALGKEGAHVKTIAKIENQEGLENFETILEEFDSIMVARGDMGMEIPLQKVFLAQKMIIRRCNEAGKPVITATQMLESMVQNPRPTRAESTDVANAVLDGSDAVMLSGETAAGSYPVEAVQTMSDIAREAEAVVQFDLDLDKSSRSNTSQVSAAVSDTVASSVVKSQIESDAKLIIVASNNPESAKIVSKYRPQAMVMYGTSCPRTARQMGGLWSSIHTFMVPENSSPDELVEKALEQSNGNKWISNGNPVAFLRKIHSGVGHRYTMELEKVSL